MQQPSSVLGEAARCSSPTDMYSSSVKDDGIRVGAYAAGQEDLGSVVVLGRTRGAGKDSSVEGAGAGQGLGDHELQPAGVEAKEGMSTCDEFHSSLDELRRVTTTSFAPSWDQVPQPEDDSSIRELLRHWDSIMLHITGEGETEENEDALLCGHGAGSLNSSLNSLPGSSVLVDEPLTWEQSMFYEKKRFMDYTSCLTPEETKEMYEHGRMPELCGSSKEDEVGLISGTAVALAVAHGGPSSVLISLGAPALFPDQTAADAVLAICKGAAPEMNLVGTETVLENLDQRTDQVRCRYAGTEKADRSPNTQPTEIMSTFGEGEGCGQPGSKHESAQVKDTRPMSQGRGISHKPGRKSSRRLPSAEAGVRGAVRDGQTNNTNHEVKEEVASEDDYNGSAPLGALKRRCRSRVEVVAEDVKCKRTLWNTDQAGGGAGRGKALKKAPQSSMKATGTTESKWRPRNDTRLRRTSRGQNIRIEPRCEMNRAQSIPEDTKCKVKRRKTVRSLEVEHSPGTSERVAVDQVILLHDADTESTLLTGAPTSRAGALETRFWRPKVWPPDHMRLDVGGAAVGPTFSNSAEFPQTGNTGSNVGTLPGSKEGPTSHQSQVSEPSQVPLVSQKLLSILSSPEFIIAGHVGVRCTYSDVVSSERVSVPAYSVAREDAKFDQYHTVADSSFQVESDHGICLLTAGSMEMAPHSKEGSCLVGVMKDPVTEPHRDIEQEGQGLGRSQEQRGSMNCCRSTVCSQLWQGLCNQGARLAPCSTDKEVPMKLSVPNSAVTVSHIPPDLSRKNLPASMEPAAQETSPREMRPLLAAPKGGSGLDRDLSLVLQESIQSPCSQKGGGSPLSHTMSNQDLENVPATQAALGMSPQQVPESDDTVTDLVISNSSSRALGNSKECPTELNERLQLHDSSECAKESEGCGLDLGKAGRTRGDGASESQLLLLTSSHFSFVQARYAIHQGLQSEQDFDGIRIIHLLMGCVEALCSGDEGIGLAGVMLTRLTEMVDVRGYPLQRVAAHFVTGLKLAFGIDMENVGQPTLTRDAKAHLGRAYQVLHEVLPYIKFAHFTANQALLEAFEGKQEMHIVDYDIMDGMQWPPLMHALAAARDQYQEDVEESRSKDENKHTTAVTPTKLKITAVCRGQLPRNSIATSVTETGRRLEAFAKSLDLQFEFQAVQEPHVRIEEESLHHIALQGAWQNLFKDLVLHEKTSSTEIGGNNPREQGREDAPQGKVPPEGDTCGSGHQLLRKLVCANSTTKNVRSSTAQGSCPEREKRVEAGKLKDDSSTDSLHQRHWSTHDYEQEGQVQHIQEQTSSPSEPMSSKRAGSARDGEWKRGRGRIRKLAGASGGHRSNQDEDTLCSENVRTKRNILPLKLLEAEIHDPTSHRASLHEKETPTRKESGQPARATKTGRHASYKRNKRLQTLLGHHTGKDPLSASRSTAGPADYAQRPEELASRNSSDSLVTLAGDSLISTKCRQDTGAKAGREEQVSVTDSDLEDVRNKGKPSTNQFLNHLNQTKQRQCVKEEELQTGSQAMEENKRPLQGGRRTMDERKTAFPNWINLVAEGADRGLQNDHDVKGNGTNRRKVQYYSRRKRPMDKKRTCTTTEVSGSSHKPVKDCPADAATKGTTTRAEDNLPLAASQEKTPGKAQKPQSSSTHDQTKVNEGITRKKADYEESVSAQKRSTSSSPDVNRGVAVNCMVHLPHMAHRETESVYSFLAAAARFSPHILTVGEDGMSVPGSENFLNYFCQGLYHFCALSDSLEESLPGKNLATAVVEQVFCAPRIASMLQSGRAHMEQQRPEDEQDAADPRRTKWSSFAPTLGFHSLPLSAANKYQGKLLLHFFPKGYEVLEGEQGDPDHRLMLAWKRRPIVAVSAWRS